MLLRLMSASRQHLRQDDRRWIDRLSERRLAWDMRQLDAAIDRLPVNGNAEAISDETSTDASDDHSWDDIDAQAKNKSAVH